jgi:hypothetical protein
MWNQCSGIAVIPHLKLEICMFLLDAVLLSLEFALNTFAACLLYLGLPTKIQGIA